jgi:trans-aconitate 2-methyltransferase
VVDLGCGTGAGTAMLCERWPEAVVVGIDSSDEMLSKALARKQAESGHSRGELMLRDGPALSAPPRGSVSFVKADILSWTPEPSTVDVIFSNAALHWIPGHEGLFGSWVEGLRKGGALAFQVPGNFDAPSHTLLADLANSAEWRQRFPAGDPANKVRSPSEYYRLLRRVAEDVDVWETTYYHRLRGDDPVFDWVSATALRPYVEALSAEERPTFAESYKGLLRVAYPREPSGETLFPFRRIFAVATRSR